MTAPATRDPLAEARALVAHVRRTAMGLPGGDATHGDFLAAFEIAAAGLALRSEIGSNEFAARRTKRAARALDAYDATLADALRGGGA